MTPQPPCGYVGGSPDHTAMPTGSLTGVSAHVAADSTPHPMKRSYVSAPVPIL